MSLEDAVAQAARKAQLLEIPVKVNPPLPPPPPPPQPSFATEADREGSSKAVASSQSGKEEEKGKMVLLFVVDQQHADSIAALEEAKEEELLRKEFISYQFNHFKMISDGSLTDIQKMREMRKLRPGEALERDEKLSMSLEDIMVRMIFMKLT